MICHSLQDPSQLIIATFLTVFANFGQSTQLILSNRSHLVDSSIDLIRLINPPNWAVQINSSKQSIRWIYQTYSSNQFIHTIYPIDPSIDLIWLLIPSDVDSIQTMLQPNWLYLIDSIQSILLNPINSIWSYQFHEIDSIGSSVSWAWGPRGAMLNRSVQSNLSNQSNIWSF